MKRNRPDPKPLTVSATITKNAETGEVALKASLPPWYLGPTGGYMTINTHVPVIKTQETPTNA